jgi:hypothetical protein
MLRGPKDYLKIGDHNAFCDVCGFKYKASELRKRWDGMMVCSSDFEMRHPQEFIRSIPEKPAPPWSRPRNDGPSPLIPTYPVGTPASTADNAGPTNFSTYGPVDGSKL